MRRRTARSSSLDCRGIFAQALGVERVGANDDFFDLGGDSLGAEIISMNISERTGHAFELSALVEHGSPRKIAALLEICQKRRSCPILPTKVDRRSLLYTADRGLPSSNLASETHWLMIRNCSCSNFPVSGAACVRTDRGYRGGLCWAACGKTPTWTYSSCGVLHGERYRARNGGSTRQAGKACSSTGID